MQIKSFECKEFISTLYFLKTRLSSSKLSEETERLEERALQDYS